MDRLFSLILILPLALVGQNFGYYAGGRSAGLAHSSVAICDAWAAHHNQAALAFLENKTLGFSYENRYFMANLALLNMALALPVRVGTLGIGISHFGVRDYNHSKFGLSYARPFGNHFSFGLQFNYHNHYIAEGFGSRGSLSLEAGLFTKINPRLNLGVHVFNPFSSYKNQETGEYHPMILRLGVSYTISERLNSTLELRKDIRFPERYAMGLEYRIVDIWLVRAGFGLQPLVNSFGMGIKLNSLQLNLSYDYSHLPGSNGNISLEYSFE